MNVNGINQALLSGISEKQTILPHLELLKSAAFNFKVSFGLDNLPEEPGLILIRGARQHGKSTWLEEQVLKTITSHGPGTALYLNGDLIADAKELRTAVQDIISLYPNQNRIRRLFIDEITAIKDWQKGLKILLDAGELRDILVVTTGSRAADLMRGTERLPGRKGRLEKTQYLFTPVSYAEFKRVCGDQLGSETLNAYCLAGGCPAACSEIAAHGTLPFYIIEMVRDWIFGEFAAAGRSRVSLIHVLENIFRRAGTPIGQYKLAKESGLANNTAAAEYVRLLSELLCVGYGFAWDPRTKTAIPRKPEKYHFINILAAAAFHPTGPRRPSDINMLPPEIRGSWYEWVVAQELWRRAAISGNEMPELLPFWQSKENEIDFVHDGKTFFEVKSGPASPMEFFWFQRSFPGAKLMVINSNRFEAGSIQGITMEDFLLNTPN